LDVSVSKKRRTCSLLDIEQNFKEFFIKVLETGQTQLRFTDLGNFQFFDLLAKEKFQTYSMKVDETTLGRYIVHLITGKSSSEDPGVPFLLALKQLDKNDSNTVSRFINESLCKI
jgi:hypothetical protein